MKIKVFRKNNKVYFVIKYHHIDKEYYEQVFISCDVARFLVLLGVSCDDEDFVKEVISYAEKNKK